MEFQIADFRLHFRFAICDSIQSEEVELLDVNLDPKSQSEICSLQSEICCLQSEICNLKSVISSALIRRPNPRRCELHRALVRIPEIEADAAAIPSDAAFDGNAELGKARLPGGNVRRVDGEREMYRSAAVVSGYEPTHGFKRPGIALLKEKEDRLRAGIERHQPIAGKHRGDVEQLLIERGRLRKIGAIESGLKRAPDARWPIHAGRSSPHPEYSTRRSRWENRPADTQQVVPVVLFSVSPFLCVEPFPP